MRTRTIAIATIAATISIATSLFAGTAAAATWKLLDGMTVEDVYAKHAAKIDHIVSNSVSMGGDTKEYSLVTTFVIGDMTLRCVEGKRYDARERKVVAEHSCYELVP